MKIAAFVNASGEVVDFFDEGKICLFGKVTESWETEREIPLSLKTDMGLGDVKQALATSINQIRDCNIFLMRELRGGIKAMLEDHGFRVWKSAGPLVDQLENVALREKEIGMEAEETVPAPVLVGELRDACYQINLVELLQSGLPHVSRDVLMPFFETVSFQRLEITCNHVPKWFNMEFPALGLRVESMTPDASGVDMSVVVVPVCGTRSCPSGRRKGSSSCHCGG